MVSIFIVLSLAGAGHAETEKVVATINGKPITLEYFNKKYEENMKFLTLRSPTKRGFLDDLVRRELAIQEAKKLGLDKDPATVERMESVLYQALIEKKLGSEFEKISVGDSEAEKYYSKNPEIRTSHIFMAVLPNAPKATEAAVLARMKKVKDQHLGSEKMSFAEAAQRFSEGPEAPMGGDLDYQTKDRLDPTFYSAAVRLGRVGAVSDVIRSRFGYHILKVTGIRPWDEVDRPKIKRLVFEERRQELFEKYIETLRRQGKVAVRSELVGE